MAVPRILKQLIESALPEGILQIVRKHYYAHRLRIFSERNEPELLAVKCLIQEGDCVIDIGANFGAYTKYLSKWVGTDGWVYSIEPVPQTYGILGSNIRRLRLSNVEAINCAISNQDGHAFMEIPLSPRGENFYRAKMVDQQAESSLRQVQVETRTLDSLFSQRNLLISFIKCDVEGHELSCLQGATKILVEQEPMWMIEIAGDPDVPHSLAQHTFSVLETRSYEAYLFDGGNLHKRRRGERSVNYFFLTPGHVCKLQEQITTVKLLA